MTQDPRRRALLLLAVGLASVSFASILVRYCTAPALSLAFYRKALASLLILVPVLLRLRRQPWDGALQRRLMPYTLGSGLILAVHFASWIAAIQLTTVASALLVMSAQPVWGALLGYLFLKESVPRRGLLAIGLSVLGVGLIAWGDMGRGAGALTGDALALLSGFSAAAYLTVGRHLRQSLPLLHYLLTVYGASAVCLGIGAVATGDQLWGFDGRTWLMIALMAVFPSALGHSLVNYAVRHMEAYRVNLSILVEPVVSTVLAALLFAEIPGTRFSAGACLVLAGVFMALWQPGAVGGEGPALPLSDPE